MLGLTWAIFKIHLPLNVHKEKNFRQMRSPSIDLELRLGKLQRNKEQN